MEYASHGTGTAALTTGIIGTGLGAINSGLFNGILGGGAAQQNYVTKDMLALQMQLVDTQKELAIKSADLSSEQKMVQVFNASNDKINNVRDELSTRIREVEAKVDANAAAQSVINCQVGSNLTLANSQIAQLFSLTKMIIPNTNVCPGWGDVKITPTLVNGGTTTA